MESMTAKMCLFLRAYCSENGLGEGFSDTAAAALLGRAEFDEMSEAIGRGAGFFFPGEELSPDAALKKAAARLAGTVFLRSAFCEAALRTETRLGCAQYVLLGAGFDTFSYREAQPRLRVFELDRPETLAAKRRRAMKAGLERKTDTAEVECDLASGEWPEKLTRSGFDPAKKSFFAALGLAHYLSREDLGRLLGSIARLTPEGSALCLDYPTGDGTTAILAAGAGETMREKYTIAELESILAEHNSLVYEAPEPEALAQRFGWPDAAGAPGVVLAVSK